MTDTTTAAIVEYRSRTAQDRTKKPMQTVMSTKYRRRSKRTAAAPPVRPVLSVAPGLPSATHGANPRGERSDNQETENNRYRRQILESVKHHLKPPRQRSVGPRHLGTRPRHAKHSAKHSADPGIDPGPVWS